MVAIRAEDVFVDRNDLLTALAAMPARGRARVADAFGIAGTGKSSLSRRVCGEWVDNRGAVALALTLPPSAPTTVGQTYNAFVEQVVSLAAALAERVGRERAFAEFSNELAAVETSGALVDVDVDNVVNANDATVTDADVGVVDVDVDVDADALEGVFGPRSRSVTSLFLRHFRPALKRTPLVVTLGDYDDVAGSTLARWLLRLLASLPNTLVLVERTPGAAKPDVAAEAQPVPPFTRDEVAELLRRHLDDDPVDRLVDAVFDWSGGHPATATIAARCLRELDPAGAAAFAAGLRPLPDDLAAAQAKSALALVSAPGAADLAAVASACAIPHRVDAELLASLLDAPPPADAIDRLREAGILETVGAREEGVFRVHSFLRDPLLDAIPAKRRKELHARAEHHLFELLSAEEPELGADARPYEAWYRYEQPAWQATLREWLYHQRGAAQTDDEQERARLGFARIFFDAFWWWGCYADFPFCSDLIADWERARGDDSAWVEDLRLVLDGYPHGWRKQGAGSWLDVEAALLGVRNACGLDGDAAAIEGGDARHTRALVDNFLAHARRYRSTADANDRRRQYERALAYYDESAHLLALGDETWELAWTLFETAELHADNGEPERAREVWRRSVEAALEQDDFELTANLHRLCADIRWQAGDVAAAFDSHARAVLHAYFFQCRTPSHRPDEYTAAFYGEQVERAEERLRTLAGAARADAAARLAAPFGGTLPPGPAAEELRATRSALTRRVDLLAEELGPAVAGDLTGIDP